MSRALGQEPNPSMVEELNRLQEQQDKIEARIKRNIAEDLNDIFTQPIIVEDPIVITRISNPESNLDIHILEGEEMWAQRVIDEQPEVEDVAKQVANSISRQMASEGTVVRPDAQMPAENAALEQKVKYLENWISRIAATGPGGGAASTITLDYPVTTVITSSYTISRRDHYIGINVAAACTVALPVTGIKAGRNLIIKDESGHCSLNPITITGTIDNDTSGAILAIDNGGLHFIYNNGWRIV